MRPFLVLVLVGLAGAACQGSTSTPITYHMGASPGQTNTPCTEMFKDGIPTPTFRDFACAEEDGTDFISAMSSLVCADETILVTSDYGWGYRGQTWHAVDYDPSLTYVNDPLNSDPSFIAATTACWGDALAP
jgi:hypothetical protein